MGRHLEALDFVELPSRCRIIRTEGVGGVSSSEVIRVDRQSEISVAKLLGVVVIDDTGHVSNDILKPGAECWFHFDCTGNAGATFNIIVNSEWKWLPINRRSGEVSKNIRPKNSVNLMNMSTIDKTLLKIAVEAYLANF